jgi:uncharacterized protein
MTPTVTHPGVYIGETPSGSRTVAGAATSVTAFVGRALRGPVDRATGITSVAEFERVFGPLWTESGLGYAVRDFYLNGGGSAVVVRVAKDAASARIDLGPLAVEAVGPGTWANDMTAGVTHPGPDEAAAVARAQGLADGGSIFTLWLTRGPETEVFPHVSTAPGPRRVDMVLQSSNLARVSGPVPDARPAVGAYGVSILGDDGLPPDHDSYVPDPATDVSGPATERGIRALEQADLVNLLVLPPVAPAVGLPDEVWAEALAYATERRAFLIVDPPPELAPAAVASWATGPAGLAGPAASHAAVYVPRLEQADPLRDGAVGSFAASGAVAGLYTRTDATRGVWKAPAGTEAVLVGTSGPSVVLSDAESGALNPQGVNVIRSLAGVGTVVWGSRTLRGADRLDGEYRYVPVRRLSLHIQESLHRGTQWAVFEPNGEALWAQLRLSVAAFLEGLFRKGALQGRSPREAYVVTCDAETTTRSDIASGVVNLLVGFAPLKPAEFVIIRLQVKAAAPPP